MITLKPPLADLSGLQVGDQVEFTGVIYTARDAAHQKLVKLLANGDELPIPLEGSVLYYVGPCPARDGQVIGSAGPTTSSRMDTMTIPLLEAGLKGMIGKGGRSQQVIDGIQQYRAVYFAAIGGAGALLARCIKKVEVVAYPELGPEAVHRLEVEGFPAIVAIDSRGRNIYQEGPQNYGA